MDNEEKNIEEEPVVAEEVPQLKIPKLGKKSKKITKNPKSPIKIPKRAKITPPTITKNEESDEPFSFCSTVDQIYTSNIEPVILPASPVVTLNVPEQETIPINQPIHHIYSNNNEVVTPAPPSSKKRTQVIPPPFSSTKRQSIKQEPLEFPEPTTFDFEPIKREFEPFISDSDPLPDIPKPTISTNLPTLSNIPNYSAMTSKEQAQHRANFRARFGLLRDYWPSYHIPDIPEDLPLEEIHARYDVYIRHLHISNDVDKYKIGLVICWLVIEAILHKLNLNIGGYTVSQMRAMNKYQKLLVELGETNYKKSISEGGGSSYTYPVEIRIIFVALINAVIFLAVKVLSTFIPSGAAEMIVETITSYLAGTSPQTGQTLFGNSETTNTDNSNTVHLQPIPETSAPWGNFDIASMIANFGSSFISGSNNNKPQPQQETSTPKYAPAYLE